MLRRLLTSRTSLSVALALVLAGYGLILGCGGGSQNSNFVTVGNPGAATGGLQLNVPLEAARQAATRALNSYTVPASVTQFRLTFFDDNNATVMTTTVDKAAVVTVANIPLTVTSVLYELLNGTGAVVGTGRFRIVITANQVYVVDPPPFDPVVTGTAAMLSTNYYVAGCDTSTGIGGSISGNIAFDGNGNVVAGGQVLRIIANSPNPPIVETFNVTGGTYAVAANRDFTATLNTDQYPLAMSGRVTLQPAGGAVYASVYAQGGNVPTNARAAKNGFFPPLSAFTTLQVASSGFSNASLSGTLMVAAFNPSALSDFKGYLTGSIVADGAGNWTGGSLTTVDGTVFPIQGGTYTVAADGKVEGYHPGWRPEQGRRPGHVRHPGRDGSRPGAVHHGRVRQQRRSPVPPGQPQARHRAHRQRAFDHAPRGGSEQ